MNASKRSNNVMNKDNVATVRDTMTTAGQIQPLKIPDAVVALAQAAAKANDLPGWPLFSPPTVQLQKCTKCPREFCSSINFRRHARVHRRTPKIDKDFPKNRDKVAAFWDKLTVDQAKTMLSLGDVVIEGVNGSLILTTLSTWMCKPGFASLPPAYARAGSELLDMIQTKALRLPIPSNELFSILDEASENTFLCINTTISIQKILFNGDTEKVATELKNVVACASYMLEQRLVESWSADKAAEALRCQKLLVEEEEAAQKRLAELTERKRMKKLRQKERRLKDLKEEDVTVDLPEIVDDATGSSRIQSLKSISDPGLYEQEDQHYMASEDDNDCNMDLSVEDASRDLGHGMHTGVFLRQQLISRRHLGRPENLDQNSFVSGPSVASKHPVSLRHSHYRDPNVTTMPNRNKTWAWKVRTEIEEQGPKDKLGLDDGHEVVLRKNSQVLIGSISVAIEDGSEHLSDFHCSKDYHYQKLPTPVSNLNIANHSVVKVVPPISHDQNGNSVTDRNRFDRNEDTPQNDGNITPRAENHSSSSVMTDESSCSGCHNAELAEDPELHGTMFSSKEAAAFLSQRWKEAIAGDHVKLVLCPEN